MNGRQSWQPPEREGGLPRWVKLLLIVAAVAILVAIAVMMLAGGGHGPQRHFSLDSAAAVASQAGGR